MRLALILFVSLLPLDAKAKTKKFYAYIDEVISQKRYILGHSPTVPLHKAKVLILYVDDNPSKLFMISRLRPKKSHGRGKTEVIVTKELKDFLIPNRSEQYAVKARFPSELNLAKYANLSRGPSSKQRRSYSKIRPKDFDEVRERRGRGSNRIKRKVGLLAGIGTGDPFLGFFSLGFQYNVLDFLTIAAAAGYTPLFFYNGYAASAGVRFLVPGWNFSPFIQPGVGWSRLSFSGTTQEIFGVTATDGLLDSFYFQFPFGVSWQFRKGLSLQLAFNWMVASTFGSNAVGFTFNFGYFFGRGFS